MIIVATTGVFALGLSILEKHLIKKDDDRANWVNIGGKLILMSGFVIGIIYFLHNPFWGIFKW